MSSPIRRASQILGGLISGLLVMEGAFHLRDDGAFPHVNFYIPDTELGVRLEPGAQARMQFRENPLTSIRINSIGYRGDEPPAPDPSEILVVGDSQVFGLGVEEDETFSSQLQTLTGRPVFNAGVPTYGPEEYSAVVADILATRKPSTVIYTVNFVNDLFESSRPNRQRHAVWDGWAVRSETAPESMVSFPGRKWLMSKSHAVYGIRRLLHGSDPQDPGFASEGSWEDVTEAGQASQTIHAQFDHERAGQAEERVALDSRLQEIEQEVQTTLLEAVPDLGNNSRDAELLVQASHGDPGDILSEQAIEAGREILVTAKLIRKGVKYRAQLEAQLEEREGEKIDEARDAIARRDRVIEERKALFTQGFAQAQVRSPLMAHIEPLHELCAQHGAELLVLALPMDVQVSSEEWAKYGVDEPIDMEPSHILLADLVAGTEQLGARALDVTSALGQAQPGAFLDADIHMTPKGHAAVAAALASHLETPPPIRLPSPGLPEGRTPLPRQSTWLQTPERIVYGSTAADCETVQIDEWLRITCLRTDRNRPTGVRVLSGDHGEAMTLTTADATTLVTPIFPGEELVADFNWTNRQQQLTVKWEEREDGTLRSIARFSKWASQRNALAVDPLAQALCDCHQAQTRERQCETNTPDLDPDGPDAGFDQFGSVWNCTDSCAQLYGSATAGCSEKWADDCGMLLACAQRDPIAWADCPEGSVHAGGTGACFVLCDDAHPCTEGSCQPWQGTGICW